MSIRSRNYVSPNGEMFRAAAYDTETGECVRSAGPYATKGAAMSVRGQLRRSGVRVVVEKCWPTWVTIPGTELETSA